MAPFKDTLEEESYSGEYGLALRTGNTLQSVEFLAENLRTNHPSVVEPVEDLVRCVLEFGPNGASDKPGNIFELARRIKGTLPPEHRNIASKETLPYAMLLSDLLDISSYGEVYIFHENDGIESGDLDGLELGWASAWESVKYGVDEFGNSENLLAAAIAYARLLPKNWQSDVSNKYMRLILGAASYLQDRNQGEFLLPQENLAKLLPMPQSNVSYCIVTLCKSDKLYQVEQGRKFPRARAATYVLGPKF